MSDVPAVAKDRVVCFHYVLRDEDGTQLDASEPGEPVAVLIGHGNLMPGLEAALDGHLAGDRLEVTLAPERAFGARQEGRIQRVSKKYVANAQRLKPGMQTQVHTESGARTVTVVKVGSKVLDLDMNHPFAGKTVTFTVDVESVRPATSAELAHGHAHGAGGHQH
jgi:FKBP-type peptidyl-prolyl cis-trans isomerase SlyD